MIKVVITGPESSGKTTLCEELARHYNLKFVKEYSRDYLDTRDGHYSQEDLIAIAKGQIAREDGYAHQPLLVCDTSLEVIRIWSLWKYQNCADYITESAKSRTPNLFLLLKPDIPWQADPQRENPHDRHELFDFYQKDLIIYNCLVHEISGTRKERLQDAIAAIDNLIN